MGITGSQVAYKLAQSGVMRSATSRSNYHSQQVFVSIAGVQYAAGKTVTAPQVDNETLSISETEGQTPNTCAFAVRGFTPSAGQDVVITLGSINNLDREFAGTIITDTSGYVGIPSNERDQVSVIDYTWQLTLRTITKRWTNVSATTIAQQIIADVPGFTSNRVQTGLATVDEFTVTSQTHAAALSALAKRIGATFKATYLKDVRFGIAADVTQTDPTTLTAASAQLTEMVNFKVTRDLSQVVTRQPVEGGGSTALADVAVGETILPVATPVWYNPGGGTVATGPQYPTYTGVQQGGGGTLVGPGAAPAAAPVAAASVGSGVETGDHDYVASFVTAAGESLVGPRRTVSVGWMAAPATAPTADNPTAGSGPDLGEHQWAVAFVDGSGNSTPPGPRVSKTTSLSGGPVSAPNAAPTLTPQYADGVVKGTVQYAVTFTTSAGETTPGPTVNGTALPITYSGNPSPSAIAGGSLTPATYNWAATYVTANGEGVHFVSSSAQILAGSNLQFRWTIPGTQSSDPRITATKLYRTKSTGGTLYLVATISLGTTTFDDNVADGSLTVAEPGTDTAQGGKIDLSNLPVSSDSRVTGKKLYRTASGPTGSLKLVASIAAATTTYADIKADADLGATAPTTNTAAQTLGVVPLSSIPLGPSGVTARDLYRTPLGSSTLKFLARLNDNTTTTYSDTTADSGLGAVAPTSSTIPANQVSLSSIPTGAAAVTSRKIYRTAVGASQLKLLTTVGDNTTTTYTDSTADASLGANAPTSDTSGLTQPTGQVAAGSSQLILAAATDFVSTGGWAIIGTGQAVRYTGKTATALTGIPTSGNGAIGTTIAYNTSARPAPALTGIPASGAGSIVYAIKVGDQVNVRVVLEDLTAQVAIAALMGGTATGVIEGQLIQDGRISETEARARGLAQLELRKNVDVAIGYTTRDKNTHAGRTVAVNLTAPIPLVASFKVKAVTTSNFFPSRWPTRQVSASSSRFTLEDLLRLARAVTG